MVTVFSGFLASAGYLNLFIAYVVLFSGDFIGDCLYYSLGRFGREKFIKNYGHYIGVNLERVEKLEKHFQKHAAKTLLAGKFLHGLGTVALIAAGLAKVSYKKLFSVNLGSTALKSLILILIGFYFGKIYAHLNYYLALATLIVVFISAATYVIFIRTGLAAKIIEKF